MLLPCEPRILGPHPPPVNRFFVGLKSTCYGATVWIQPVNLRAVRYRPESFKPDNQLRNRATQLCEQLDLRQMPGFALEQGKVPPIHASVFYTPWKGGPKPH